jgi:hypothetical protein
MSRRRLLALGAGGMLSLTLARPGSFVQTAEAKPAKGQPSRVVAPLSIGFNSGGADDVVLIDAGSLPSGDPELALRGARFKVLELCPSNDPVALETLQWLTVDVAYTPYHDTHFLAWSFYNGSVPRLSAPLAVTVPIEEPAGLHLLVSYQIAGASELVQSVVRLSTGQESGTPKLATGIYVVALAGTDGTLPDWRKHQLVTESTETGRTCWVLYEKVRADYVAARIPHLLVSIS